MALRRAAAVESVNARASSSANGLISSVPQASVVDLHVDAHVRYADPEALFAALETDCSRLAELWDAGHLGGEVVVVANTFHKRMLASMEARLGLRGATSGRRGCLLQRESADAHSPEFRPSGTNF